jgi:hypothetical protein
MCFAAVRSVYVYWSLAGEKSPVDDKSFIPAATGLSHLI